MSVDRLRELIIKHEGLSLKPYRCPAGRLTIGVGRNLEANGISYLEAMVMLSNDLSRVQQEAVDNFQWFKSISVVRQDVVLDMIFNLGLDGVRGFAKMISAIQCGDFEKAADEMLHSLWHKQVGYRAVELANMMRTGRYL